VAAGATAGNHSLDSLVTEHERKRRSDAAFFFAGNSTQPNFVARDYGRN